MHKRNKRDNTEILLRVLVLALVGLSGAAFANVKCSGVPSAVYAGIHGPGAYGSTYWVSLPNVGTMPIGRADDELAKSRFAMAQMAFIAKKTLILQYYSHTSCAEASRDIATPTYAAIVD